MKSKAKTKSVPVIKVPAVKGKAKGKAKSKTAKKRPVKRTAPAMNQVPAAMAPPEMPDTRPRRQVPVPEPKPAQVPEPEGERSTTRPSSASTSPTTRQPDDGNLVQGAQCTWLGPLSATERDDQGIPIC